MTKLYTSSKVGDRRTKWKRLEADSYKVGKDTLYVFPKDVWVKVTEELVNQGYLHWKEVSLDYDSAIPFTWWDVIRWHLGAVTPRIKLPKASLKK